MNINSMKNISLTSLLALLLLLVGRSQGQGSTLTASTIDQLVLVDRLSVGDFTDIAFDSSGQYFVVFGQSNGMTTYDRQAGERLAYIELSIHIKHLEVASDASFYIQVHKRGEVDEGYFSPFDSIQYEGPFPTFVFNSQVNEIALIENDTVLLAALENGDIALYQVSDQSFIRQWLAHEGGVADVVYENGLIWSIGRDFHLKSWLADGTLQSDLELPTGEPAKLLSDGQDKLFVLYTDGRIVGIDRADEGIIFEVSSDNLPFDFAYHPTENALVTVSTSGQIRRYTAETGDLLSQAVFQKLQAIPLQIMALDPLNDDLIVGGFDGELHWLDRDGQITNTLRATAHNNTTVIDVDVFGANMVVQPLAPELRVWNLATQTWRVIGNERLMGVEFSTDGRWLASFTNDASIVAFDVANDFSSTYYPTSISENGVRGRHSHFIYNTSYCVLVDFNGGGEVWDVSTGLKVADITPPSPSNDITAMTSSADYLVIGYRTGNIRVWALANFNEIPEWSIDTGNRVGDMIFWHSPQQLFISNYISNPDELWGNGYAMWQLRDSPRGTSIFSQAEYAYGSLLFTPDKSAGLRAASDTTGFMTFANSLQEPFVGRADYPLDENPTFLAMNEDASRIFVGINYEILIYAVGGEAE